ncbi:MAG: aldehyde dehydrogenase family protein, partial [Chloroflexota bacterium]
MNALLKKLKIDEVNPSASFGMNNWITDPKGKELVSYNPTTGEPIAKIIQATQTSYDQVVKASQKAFSTWRDVPAPKRGDLVRDLGNATRELKEPLGDLISLEMGKIKSEGHGEVQEMIDICDFAVGQSRQLYGLTMHSERPKHRMYEQWHPLGIVGVITAFNFPVAVWSWNSTIAAIAGDTVLWKPSEISPLAAIAMQHICNQVMADHGVEGVFSLVLGDGPEVGEILINDDRIPLVSVTGSPQVGRHISQTVAKRFGRSLLELGGNNAIIVAPDADLDLAVRGIVFGSVGTSGQRCTTTRRIIMHKDIASELTERLVNAYD